ncbi:MAG: hypothetical protein LBM65_05265 [Oscillospiraceae bacterium]|jgi:hypothetical protein|nr:hypothetical protein [Oscillospiraceae bacterium]
MNLYKKFAAAVLAIVIVVTMAACGAVPITLNHEWSFKNGDDSLSIGVYSYCLYSAYNTARGYAEKEEGYSTIKSFLDIKIASDDTAEKIPARDWIKKEAALQCKTILAVRAELKKRGLTASPDEVENARNLVKEDWEMGPNYSYYSQMVNQGYMDASSMPAPLKLVLEPYGISQDSYFDAYYQANMDYTLLFDNTYEKDGSDPVTDEELRSYFEQNYTDYGYFKVSLSEGQEVPSTEPATEPATAGIIDDPTTTVASTEPTTTAPPQTTMVEMSKTKKEEILKKLNSYATALNIGKDTKEEFDNIVKKYMEAEDITEDPSLKSVEDITDSSNLPEEVKTALEGLEQGKATVVTAGEGVSSSYYFVYKGKISNNTNEYLTTADKRTELIRAIKTDEFSNLVRKMAENFECDENTGVVDAYKPEMFENYDPDATEAPTTVAD